MTADQIQKCKACADNLAQQIIGAGFTVGEVPFILKNLQDTIQEKINEVRL